jgi:hypothetical protein
MKAKFITSMIPALLAAPIAMAAPQEPVQADPALPAKPITKVVASSTLWQEASEEAQGKFRITRTTLAGKTTALRLDLGPGFATDSGPDLKVVLSPTSVDKVSSKTALNGGLILGKLKTNKGASSYSIALDTDLSKYQSVLIHCEKFTKLWAKIPLSGGEVVAFGSRWSRKAKSIRGSWELAQNGKDSFLRFGEDFRTKSAPDLKLVLSKNKLSAANNDNALQNAVIVAQLKKVKGTQEYRLPKGVDLKDYASLLIHCKEYSKLWGGAQLRN